MRRIATVFSALAVAGACATGALADQPAPATMGMAQGAVIVAACHPSDDVTTRFATFVGEMRALPGSARMAMRFTLLQRLGTPDFTAVGLPDLRPWRRSKKGVSSFIYTQRVTALRDGGTYRMRVQMRWYGSNGKLMKVRTMRSGACKQPAPLPNLRISSISTAPGAVSGTTSYMVTVQNDGDTPGCALHNNVLYFGGHFNYVGVGCQHTTAPPCFLYHHVAAANVVTNTVLSWNPGANSNHGIYTVRQDATHVGFGGYQTKFGGKVQEGYATYSSTLP